MLSKRSIVCSTSSDLHLVHFRDQALSQKELEKTSLSEQLAALQQEQHSAAMELERTKRESLSKQEQDKVKKTKTRQSNAHPHIVSSLLMCECFLQNAMADLQHELQTLRTRFEESLNSYEDSKKSLSVQVREFGQQKEEAQQEVRGKKIRLVSSSLQPQLRCESPS